MKIVSVEYIGSIRYFVLEDEDVGGFYIRPEGGDIINPDFPYSEIPSKKQIEYLSQKG